MQARRRANIDSLSDRAKITSGQNDARGICVVSSADEYRAYADECLGWARTAKSDREREIFIQMGQTWLAAAVRAAAADAPTTLEQRPALGLSHIPNERSD
jgi:hypothetical protein